MLIKLSEGDKDVMSDLLPLIYDELKRLAANYLRRERSDHPLQPTGGLAHAVESRLQGRRCLAQRHRAQPPQDHPLA